MASSGKALIAGGSIGGLFVAAALLRRGWDVRVYERAGAELAGRGAGIVTHDLLIAALEAVGASTQDLGVDVKHRVAFDIAGAEVARLTYAQTVTSWDRIHQLLRNLIPDGAYLLGKAVAGYEETAGSVAVRFEDGTNEEADLVIGADGFRSAVRAQMLPQIGPRYSGYVVWRAVADEARFSSAVHDSVFPEFGFFAPKGSQILGYPIAGPDNDLRPGFRRYNLVWYKAVAEPELRDMLTDELGHHHGVSIPPPLVREDVLERMMTDAQQQLPSTFFEILRCAERPFFTPIYDHCSPFFAKGRVALCGDAACVARPHAGMGITKAAQDALSLARHLSDASVETALVNFSLERGPASRRAYEQARRLGRYIFDSDLPTNLDGRNNPNIETVLRETAALVV